MDNNKPEPREEFPIEVFPETVRQIAIEASSKLAMPLDFLCAAILLVCATAIGKTHRLFVKTGWTEIASIFLCLVGRPGSNKTHPLKWAMAPLKKRMNETFQEYLQQKAANDAEDLETEGGEKPVWQQIVLSNVTVEALMVILAKAGLRLLVWCDELASLLKNFGRYNKGSDEEYYLSLFNGTAMVVNRKTQDPLFIPDPIACLAGTMQNGIFQKIYCDRQSNGFFDRMLNVFLKDDVKLHLSTDDLDESFVIAYEEFVTRLLDLEMNGEEPYLLKFSPSAESLALEWYNKNVDTINEENDDQYKSLYSKLDIYFFRFCLVLQLMSWASGEGSKFVVQDDIVEKAKLLAEYFRVMGCKAIHLLSTNPLHHLTEVQLQFYSRLSSPFSWNTALMVADAVGMSRRSAAYLLNKKTLFKKVRAGEYEKVA